MAELIADFTVLGVAKTAGSKKGFVNPRTGRVIITDDTGKPGKEWRSDVRDAALESFVDQGTGDLRPIDGALEVEITFWRTRPKGHFGSGRQTRHTVRDAAPAHPTTKPDVDKLSRAVLDALKGVAWHDDAQVTDKIVRKRYALDHDHTQIKIFRADSQLASDLPVGERVKGDVWGERAAAQASLLAVAA